MTSEYSYAVRTSSATNNYFNCKMYIETRIYTARKHFNMLYIKHTYQRFTRPPKTRFQGQSGNTIDTVMVFQVFKIRRKCLMVFANYIYFHLYLHEKPPKFLQNSSNFRIMTDRGQHGYRSYMQACSNKLEQAV